MELKISVGPACTNVGDELYYSAVCARRIAGRCNSKNEVTAMACVPCLSKGTSRRGRTGDFHLFWPLKGVLRARHFRSDEEVKEAVHDWLAQQSKDSISRGIQAVVKRWRCVESGRGCSKD